MIKKTDVDGVLTDQQKSYGYEIKPLGDSKWIVERKYYMYDRYLEKFVYFDIETQYEGVVVNENGLKGDFLRSTKLKIKYADALESEDWKLYREREDFYDGIYSLGYVDKNYIRYYDSAKHEVVLDEYKRNVEWTDYDASSDGEWTWIPYEKYTCQYYGTGRTRTSFEETRYNQTSQEWTPYLKYEWEYDYDVPIEQVQANDAINMTRMFSNYEYLMKSEKRTLASSNRVEFTVHNYEKLTPENGVDEIISGADEADAIFYSLSGVRVNAQHLDPGIYIKVVGDKSSKICVK